MSNSDQIKITFDDIPQYVFGVRNVIESAIDNLVDNAKKYSSEGSMIQINGSKLTGSFRIDVIDNGIGIDPSYHRYLFEKFFRAPQNPLHNVKGLGLELYLSKKALISIEGNLKLTESTENGSIFTIYLKLA